MAASCTERRVVARRTGRPEHCYVGRGNIPGPKFLLSQTKNRNHTERREGKKRGNDTTFIRLLEMASTEGRATTGKAIIGIPVGFVGAGRIQGKHSSTIRVEFPFIAVRGRIGGSANGSRRAHALARAGF